MPHTSLLISYIPRLFLGLFNVALSTATKQSLVQRTMEKRKMELSTGMAFRVGNTFMTKRNKKKHQTKLGEKMRQNLLERPKTPRKSQCWQRVSKTRFKPGTSHPQYNSRALLSNQSTGF
jgi:hypothetical protein